MHFAFAFGLFQRCVVKQGAEHGQRIRDRVGSYVGLAAKAGHIVSGEALCRRALHSGKGHLIVLAEDVNATIRTRFTGLSQGKGVPMVAIGTKEDLGHWTGKSPRSAILIRDQHLAKAILHVKANPKS